MKKRLLAIATLTSLACGIVLNGQEAVDETPMLPLPDPELAARLEVNSIMRLTQRVSVFADKLQPGSSGLLVVGMIGLTVNPKVVNYDLSKPFSVLAYSDPNGIFGRWGLCGVVWRRAAASKPDMKVGNFTLSIKDMEGRAALASSPAILDHIPDDLKKDPSAKSVPNAPDLSLWLDVGKALSEQSLAEMLTPAPSVDAESLIPPERLEAAQAAAARLQSIDSILRQTSSIKADLSISDNNRARLDLRMNPVAGSALESFLKSPSDVGGAFPQAVSVRGAVAFGAVAAKPDAKLAGEIALACARKAEATGDGARAAAFSDFASLLLAESVEGAGFCGGRFAGKAFGVVSLRVSKDSTARLEKALAGFASKTSTFRLFRMREWKSGVSSYCLLDEGRVWLLCGRFDEEDAADTLSTRKTLPSIGTDFGLLAFATLDDGGVSPKTACLRVESGTLDLKLEFTPADIDRLPLPQPPPGNDKVRGLGLR